MKHRKITALILAGIIAVAGAGQTAMAAGAEMDFRDSVGRGDESRDVNYDVWFEDQDMRDGGNSTWMFRDEELTFHLNTDHLAGVDCTFVWQAGDYSEPDENGEVWFIENKEIKYTLSDDRTGITLKGSELPVEHFNVCVTVKNNEEEIAWADFWVNVRDTKYEYHMQYFYDDSTIYLPRQDFGIDRNSGCFVEDKDHPGGEELPVTVTGVTAVNADDDEGVDAAVNVEPWEDGNGWNLHTNRVGHALVTVNYTDWNGMEDSYHFEVYIKSERYLVDVFSSTGTYKMLPNKSLTLDTTVSMECYDEETDTHYPGDVSDVQIRWEYDENSDTYAFDEKDGKLTVTALQDGKGTNIRAVVLAEGEEVASVDYWTEVFREYYTISGVDPDGIWEYSGVKTMSPVLKHFHSDQPDGVVTEAARYRIEGDWWAFSVTDTEGNAVTEDHNCGQAPFTVTRKTTERFRITLIADLYDEESDAGNEEDKYYEVERRDVWVDGMDYSVWFEDGLREDHYTWVFSDEDVHVSLNTERLQEHDMEAVTVEWLVGVWNDEAQDITEKLPSNVYTGSAEGIILHGELLDKIRDQLRNTSGFDVQVIVKANDEEVFREGFGVDLRDPVYDYWMPYFQEGSIEQLPRWNLGIDRNSGCWLENADHPYGEEFPVEVTYVSAKNADDDEGEGDAVTVEPWDDGNGWNVRMNRQGHAIVTVMYKDWDGQKASYTIDVYIQGEIYYVDIYSDTETSLLLPGKSLTLNVNTRRECYDEKNDVHFEGDISDVEIRWEYDENHRSFTFKEENNGNLTVTARDDAENYDSTEVRAIAYVGEEEVASCNYRVEVQKEYHTIFISEFGDGWEYKEEDALVPVLKRFNSGMPDGETTAAARYRVEGDWWAFSIKDANGNVITEEDNCGTAPFTVTRKTIHGFRITLAADLYDEERDTENEEGRYYEVARQDIRVDGINCGISFGDEDGANGLRKDHYTWLFNDETMTIPVRIEHLDVWNTEGVTAELLVGVWNKQNECLDQIELPAGACIFDRDGITLNGEILFENRNLLKDECNFDVQVIVRVDGEEVSREGFGADVREPFAAPCDDWDEDVLSDYSKSFEKGIFTYYVSNKEHPYGQRYDITITDITVEDLREDPDADNPVLTAKKSADGSWKVEAHNYGTAVLHYTAMNDELGEVTFDITKDVVEEYFRASLKVDPYPVMLPGAEITLRLQVWHYAAGKKAELLTADRYSIVSLDYNRDWFEITEDKTSHELTVRANEEWEIEDVIHGMVKIPLGKEGEFYETDFGNRFWICSEYDRVDAEDIITEPGATVTAADMKAVLKRYNAEYPDGKALDQSAFQLEILEDSKYFVLNKGEESFKVKDNILGLEDLPVTERVVIRPSESMDGIPQYLWVDVTVCSHKGTKTTIPVTCTTDGSITVTCEKCGKVLETTVQPAAGHKMVTIIDSEATCAVPGRQHTECSVCHGNRKELPDIAATGKHSYGNYSVTRKATALEEGTETRTCAVCHASESRVIPRMQATISVPGTGFPLKIKQKISFKVTELADGDFVKSWTSSNTKIVKVTGDKKGTIKLTAQKKTGKATITITTAAGAKATISVNVQKADVVTKKIKGVSKKITLKKKEVMDLKAVPEPLTSRQKLTYASSNKKIVSVSAKGKIKGMKPGKAVITIKSGKAVFKCAVTVKG